MRSDMHKVIVERPRLGHSERSKKTARRWSPSDLRRVAAEGDDYDSGPRRATSARHGKSLNEHLQPLYRFLRKQVDRPWDKVYSELREVIDSRSTVRQHILEHVHGEVATSIELVEEHGRRVPYEVSRWSGRRPVNGLYVDPRTGLLRRTPVRPRIRGGEGTPTPDTVWVNDALHYRKVRGLWYTIETRPATEPEWKVFTYGYWPVAISKQNPPLVAHRWRQCGKRVVRELERGDMGPVIVSRRPLLKVEQIREIEAIEDGWQKSRALYRFRNELA